MALSITTAYFHERHQAQSKKQERTNQQTRLHVFASVFIFVLVGSSIHECFPSSAYQDTRQSNHRNSYESMTEYHIRMRVEITRSSCYATHIAIGPPSSPKWGFWPRPRSCPARLPVRRPSVWFPQNLSGLWHRPSCATNSPCAISRSEFSLAVG